MSEVSDSAAEGTNAFDDVLDQGLAEAFGDAGAPRPAPSVLAALEARTGSALSVHLESSSLEDEPVRITEEAQKLRGPAGRYQVLGEIGRGGVGIVYKSRDIDLGRDVAMKVLKDEYAQRPDVLARFVEEAQIGGQLQHPGIVPVYELGMHAGERLYFAMKLVRGETLAAQLAGRASPAEDRRRLLGVFEQICQTIAYAHARRVVHRDLKPANVMIGAFGEVQVVDWGFAKVLALEGAAEDAHATPRASEPSVIETVRSGSGSPAQSVPGSMMGTPAYMPPEQAQGDVEHLDRRTDVFALGAILCEILCGEAPYREQDGDLVRQAANAELGGALERLRVCGADEALVALCTECLAPARRARPSSASEVAERLSAWLTSVEERARQAELRAAEARYKQRATALTAAAGLIVLVLGAGAWRWMQGELQDRRAGAAQRVTAAMSAASGARGQAQAAGLDTALWSAATSSAEQLVALAQSDDVLPAAREEAEGLLALVRAEQSAAAAEAKRRARDVAMVERLETLDVPTGEREGNSDWAIYLHEQLRRDAAYREAFAAYLGNMSLFEHPADVVLVELQRGDIEVILAIALDHWALVRDGMRDASEAPEPAATSRIRELASLLDPSNPWRAELRALLLDPARERERVKSFAEHADFTSLDTASYRLLSDALEFALERDTLVDVLRRGQELHPQDFDLCLRLATSLHRLEPPRLEEAVATYRIAHALRPGRYDVPLLQAMALAELGRHADAERICRGLPARDPRSSHWGILEIGKQLLHQGKYPEAVEWCRRALEIQPRSDEAAVYTTLGIAFHEQGKGDEAVESYQRALEIDPQHAPAHVGLGLALQQQGKPGEALESHRRALEIDPQYAPAHEGLGRALQQLGHLDEAIESFRRALEVDRWYADAHAVLGRALLQQGKPDEAVENLRRALEVVPRYGPVHDALGNAFLAQGKLDEAVDSFRRAVEIAPRYAGAHVGLGNALLQQGKLDEAIESLRRGLELEPQYATVHNRLGTALEKQGNFEEAIKSYRNAVEIDPQYAPAYVNLGNMLRYRDVEGALAAYERAAELFAQDGIWGRPDGAFARQWGSYAQEQIQALQHLPARDDVLAGRRPAASPEEWDEAVLRGYTQGRLLEVVTLTEQTLQISLAQADRAMTLYNSACAAALLAASSAQDLSASERVRIRELARAWLAGEVDRWTTWLARGGERAPQGRLQLQHALQDPDFASVRGDALMDLPQAERTAWQEVWGAVARAIEEEEN